MINNFLARAVWLSLKTETRAEIARIFGIKRSGTTEVINDIVITDGFTDKDLSGITLPKLQVFLNSTESDFYKLFKEAVVMVENMLRDGLVHFPITEPGEGYLDLIKQNEQSIKENESQNAPQTEGNKPEAKRRGRKAKKIR